MSQLGLISKPECLVSSLVSAGETNISVSGGEGLGLLSADLLISHRSHDSNHKTRRSSHKVTIISDSQVASQVMSHGGSVMSPNN